jgi:hypothetical protein
LSVRYQHSSKLLKCQLIDVLYYRREYIIAPEGKGIERYKILATLPPGVFRRLLLYAQEWPFLERFLDRLLPLLCDTREQIIIPII